MSQRKKPTIEFAESFAGYFTPVVVDAKTGEVVRRYKKQKNLILDSGMNGMARTHIGAMLVTCLAGTGSTPTKDLTSSSYTQTSTTVTRQSGSFAFTSGMIGRLILFGDGSEAKITGYTSASEVTVDRSQTVPVPRKPGTITSISSDAVEFTVAATAHGLTTGDRVTIAGTTVVDYHSTWEIEVVDADTFKVAETSNFGSATGGTFERASVAGMIFRVEQTALATYVKSTTTRPTFTDPVDGLPATCVNWLTAERELHSKITYDFSEESGNVNYTEIGLSNNNPGAGGHILFSRILLLGAVTVEAGQLLRVIYDLVWKGGYWQNEAPLIKDPIPGWPRPYNVASITSDGSGFTVTFPEAHHYVAAGKINLSGIKKPRSAITAADSTVSDFTLTAPGHGISGGDVIVVEDVTPSGYNGVWTVASVAGDDITVTSAVNPGTGTLFGNVREQEPQPIDITGIASTWDDFTITAPGHGLTGGDTIVVRGVTPEAYNGEYEIDSVAGDDITILDTRNLGSGSGGTLHEKGQLWYDDEWTIASVTSTTVVVSSTLNLGTVNANEGTCVNNVNRRLYYNNLGTGNPTRNLNQGSGGLVRVNGTTPRVPALGDQSYSNAWLGAREDNNSGGLLAPYDAGTQNPQYAFFITVNYTPRSTRWPSSCYGTTAAYIVNDNVNFPNETIMSVDSSTVAKRATGVVANYTNGSFFQDKVFTWGAGVGNYSTIFGILFTLNGETSTNVPAYIYFDQRQRKDSTHRFVLTVRRRWNRRLTFESN